LTRKTLRILSSEVYDIVEYTSDGREHDLASPQSVQDGEF
jgi:hypothetical protein